MTDRIRNVAERIHAYYNGMLAMPIDDEKAITYVATMIRDGIRSDRPDSEIEELIAEARALEAGPAPNETDYITLADELLLRLADALEAEHRRTEAYKLHYECPICYGTPHVSGLVCICDGKNTSVAAIEGFQREVRWLESQLAEAQRLRTASENSDTSAWNESQRLLESANEKVAQLTKQLADTERQGYEAARDDAAAICSRERGIDETVYCYVGVAPCDCGLVIMTDKPEYKRDTAKEIGKLVRKGFTIERLEIEAAKARLNFDCPHRTSKGSEN